MSMRPVSLAFFMCLSLASACHAQAMRLEGQVTALAADIQTALKENPLVKGKELKLGQIVGEGQEAGASNFGLEIERQLREALAEVLADASDFTLAGSYLLLPAELPENNGLKVLVLTLQIKNRGRQILAVTREVNHTDNIFQAIGLTGAAPQKPNATVQERNGSVEEATEKPTFQLVDGHRVAAPGRPEFSMGILKKRAAAGATQPTPPQNVQGLPFVPIAVREYYEIELKNTASHDVVAQLTVDGLDVANTFSADKDEQGQLIHWPGYLLPKGETVVIRGWLHTIDPAQKDNVFSFLVAELGQGAASALKARGTVGVITAQFREACPPNGTLKRSFGETAKGEGLEEKYTTQAVQIGDNVLSTVSIRYNRP